MLFRADFGKTLDRVLHYKVVHIREGITDLVGTSYNAACLRAWHLRTAWNEENKSNTWSVVDMNTGRVVSEVVAESMEALARQLSYS